MQPNVVFAPNGNDLWPVQGAEVDRPLFRFVQFNDVHIAYDNKDTYSKAREKFEAVLADVAGGRHAPRPDLMVTVGDIANGSTLDRLTPDNLEAATMLRRLAIPVLPIPGNHEVMQGEGDPDLETPYAQAFGADLLTYAVFYQGLLFIMINDTGGRAGGDAVSDRRNAAVADLLDRYAGVPKIIACHIPLVPFREPKTLAESFGFSTWKLVGNGGLLPIIEKHRDTVIAVLNGHLHLTGHVVVNGIHHISVSGTASYPCHYAEYAVFPDRLHVKMRQPTAELITALAGDIHSRKGVFHTDPDHPTHEEYVAGRADEQEFDIPLTDRKRIEPTPSLLALKGNGFPAPNCKTVLLGDDRTEVQDLGSSDRVVCLPFRYSPEAAVYVTSGDGKRLYLTPAGADVWTASELRNGVPVLLPAEGTVTLVATARPPQGSAKRVNTAPLLDRERRASLPAEKKVEVGMQFWVDRPYVADLIPKELVGLRCLRKLCHQTEVVAKLNAPARVYAVFLPFKDTTLPSSAELVARGWILYREKAFNGTPYPRNQPDGAAGFDVYYRDLKAGETTLSEPRPEGTSAWVILAVAEGL